MFLFFLFCFLFCSQTANCWPDPLVPKEFVLASNYFGFNLLQKQSLENEKQSSTQKENIFFSPFSISTVMAMLQQGAQGETFNQLNSVLGFRLARIDGNRSLVANKARQAIEQLSSLDSNGSISIKMANAMMINSNFQIKDSYNETIQSYFDSEVLSADFASENELIMATINQWCSERTQGKIRQFLHHPPSPSTQLALINAVYFKGNWKNRFPINQTATGTFYGCNNETYNNVQFMKRQGPVVSAYLAELESDLVELPYEGEEVSMLTILPRNALWSPSMTYIRKALNPWYIESAISRLNEETEATIIFPKIQISGRYNLKETLKDMGLVDIFDFGPSDLTGISDQAPITVDEVRHASLIDINEDGTEAAASTYVGFVKMSLQPSSVFNFNHPFVMFIRHNPSGQILFMGEINKP